MNAEREEEREIDGIEVKGEKHRAEVSAIREKRTEIPCREREKEMNHGIGEERRLKK